MHGLRMGLSEDDFWNSTLRQLQMQNRLYIERESRRHEDLVMHAWHVANFSRAKTLPDPEVLLRRMRRLGKPLTNEMVNETKKVAEEADSVIKAAQARAARKGKPPSKSRLSGARTLDRPKTGNTNSEQ